MRVNPQQPIGQIVTENLGRAVILDGFGLDYYRDGQRTLEQVCRERALDPEDVVRALELSGPPVDEVLPDWASGPLSAIAAHIESVHHAYLRGVLPRLASLVDKIRDVHGSRHPELAAVAETFHGFVRDMEAHVAAAEGSLFPLCRTLEAGGVSESLAAELHAHETEHAALAAALTELRRLTDGFELPDGACNTYRMTFEKLLEVEVLTHLHLHKENNILFERLKAHA